MNDRDPDERGALANELFERSDAVVDLDSAQIEAWVSGLFAAWDDDHDARAFIARCASEPGAQSAALLAGVAHLADDDIARLARSELDRMAGQLGQEAAGIGRARVAQAWEVQATFGRSVVIGFRQNDDVVDHAVLAEIEAVDGVEVLVDLQLSGPPEHLLDPESIEERGLQVEPIEAAAGLGRVADAWTAALRTGVEPSVGMVSNQRLVRRRLVDQGHDAPDWFVVDEGEIDTSRGMSPAEIADADAAAFRTLQAAVGDAPAVPSISSAVVDVVRGRVAGMAPREREALLWLEWADWLGAGIGLIRSAVGTAVTPAALVDMVNRCPEVSSTIHADDREYAEWAFSLAIEHLVDHGVFADGVVSDDDRAVVHASLADAWSAEASAGE